jgi:hypothetical protein
MLVVAAGTVVLGFGTTSAWAMPPQATLRAALAGQGLLGPTRGRTQFDEREASLSTKPVKVTVKGVTYLLQGTADENLSSGSGATLDVSLEGIAPTSDQLYDYTFSPPSGIAFSFDRKAGADAAVKASNAIAPSTIDVTYTATQHQSFPCTLKDGSRGHMVFSRGTVSFSSFAFVSGTSPVFGTITKQAAKASFAYDPGCGARVVVQHICAGSEYLTVGHSHSPQLWVFGQILGPGKPVEVLLSRSSLSPTESVERQAVAVVRRADLPPPSTSQTGATAKVRTTGNPLMTGAATFTSTAEPTVKTGQCRNLQGERHTYSVTTYTGTLSSSSPLLTVNFGTGPLSFSSAKPAKLYLTTVTS